MLTRRGEELMPRVRLYAITLLLLSCGAAAQQKPALGKKAPAPKPEDFCAEMQKLRDSWVLEFNSGQAEKVAAFYAPEAVLMRWDGTVHGYDSILAEMQRSISAGAGADGALHLRQDGVVTMNRAVPSHEHRFRSVECGDFLGLS